jgi:hypothetical protein
MDVRVRWSEGWEEPKSLDVTSEAELRRLLGDIHNRASRTGLPTGADVERDERVVSIVLGADAGAFLQWMGGGDGSYLGVDVGESKGMGDLLTFTYQGHHSEIPAGECVPLTEALDEVMHFARTGSLSSHWRWTGWLSGAAHPGSEVQVVSHGH